jgi:hypothetical protein
VARPCASVTWLVVAACGRLGFDQAPDARRSDAIDAGGDAPSVAATPDVLQVAGYSSDGGSSFTAPIAAVTPGDLVLVAVTVWDATAVSAVHDDHGIALALAGARAVMSTTSTEIWYVDATEASTTMTVEMTGSATGFDVFIAEVASIAPGPPELARTKCVQYPPSVAQATVDAPTGAFVFGSTMLEYPVYAEAVEPPFTALPLADGNGAAYTIAPGSASQGPSWLVGSGAGMSATTCSSTLAFAPAP